MNRPVVIGIAGGTGSGKTTITKAIQKEIKQNINIISQDAYYRSLDNIPFDERAKNNYDHPNSFDNELLIYHIRELKKSHSIQIPVYDFTQHIRKEETNLCQPSKVIVVEGILIFENKKLRDEMDIKIFVDTDSDIRILRRIKRDMVERGRSLESIMKQYEDTVRPMHIEFVEPSKRFANVILPEGGFNSIGIDMIIAKLKSILL